MNEAKSLVQMFDLLLRTNRFLSRSVFCKPIDHLGMIVATKVDVWTDVRTPSSSVGGGGVSRTNKPHISVCLRKS